MNYFWVTVILLVTDASAVQTDGVSVFVMEGDSVTLHTDVIKTQVNKVKWYYNGTRIAQITGDPNKTCTDVQCNEGHWRFRGRLHLDHQTGSLTIRNIKNTDSGPYHLQIIITSSSRSEKIFNVTIHDVPAAEMNRKLVKEGESVTLDPGVMKKPNDFMMWLFNNIPINEIGNPSRSCADVKCKDGRHGLEVNETGSLIIRNIKTTDSGLYILQVNSSRFSIMRTFSVNVTAVPDSNLSTAAVAGIGVGVVAVVVLVAAAVIAYAVCYSHHSNNKQGNGSKTQPSESETLVTSDRVMPSNQNDSQSKDSANETSSNKNDPQSKDITNGASHIQNDSQMEDTTNGMSPNQNDSQSKFTTDLMSPNHNDFQSKNTTDGMSPNPDDSQSKDSANGMPPNKNDRQSMDTTDGTSHNQEYIPYIDDIDLNENEDTNIK